MTEQRERETVHSLVDTNDGKHCGMHQTIFRGENVFGIFSALSFQMASENQLEKRMN